MADFSGRFSNSICFHGRIMAERFQKWRFSWALQGSNLRPADYESAALTN